MRNYEDIATAPLLRPYQLARRGPTHSDRALPLRLLKEKALSGVCEKSEAANTDVVS
jgi:hypothetical protein